MREQIAAEFNRIIERRQRIADSAWQGLTVSKRAEKLRERRKLSVDDRALLNRLFLDSVFSSQIKPCPTSMVAFHYAFFRVELVPPLPPEIAGRLVTEIVVVGIGMLVGVFGLTTAVLATAPIIPNMFSSGAIYLIATRPIRRPLLLVAKFIGGCSFILIVSVYLVMGVWIILGIQFGMWRPHILLAIPVFLLGFVTFYSVSVLAGLVFKNSVVATVAAMSFWLFCTFIGSSEELLERFYLPGKQISHIHVSGDQVFATRRNGEVMHWNDQMKTMNSVFVTRNQIDENLLFDPTHNRIVALDQRRQLPVILVSANNAPWRMQSALVAPKDARSIHLQNDQLIVVGDKVYNVPLKNHDQPACFGGVDPKSNPTAPWQAISDDIGISGKSAKIAFDNDDGSIYVASENKLFRLIIHDGRYHKKDETKIDMADVMTIDTKGSRVVLAGRRANEDQAAILMVENGAVFTIQNQLDVDIRKLSISSDGNLLFYLDGDNQLVALRRQGRHWHVDSQYEATFGTFTNKGLVIADEQTRLITLAYDDLAPIQIRTPELSGLQQVYHHLISPIHACLPKPNGLQDFIEQSVVDAKSPNKPKRSAWRPIAESVGFSAFVLTIASVYIYRQEF